MQQQQYATPEEASDDSGLATGAIAGIAVSSAVVVMLLAAIVVLLLQRKKRSTRSTGKHPKATAASMEEVRLAYHIDRVLESGRWGFLDSICCERLSMDAFAMF